MSRKPIEGEAPVFPMTESAFKSVGLEEAKFGSTEFPRVVPNDQVELLDWLERKFVSPELLVNVRDNDEALKLSDPAILEGVGWAVESSETDDDMVLSCFQMSFKEEVVVPRSVFLFASIRVLMVFEGSSEEVEGGTSFEEIELLTFVGEVNINWPEKEPDMASGSQEPDIVALEGETVEVVMKPL